MHLMYLLAITAATQSIHLSSAYFVPDGLRSMRLWMLRGAASGPDHHAGQAHRYGSRAAGIKRGWGDLLKAGIEISEYQPTMFHCKVMVIDRLPGIGRLDQFRQPLVPAQRRSEPEYLRQGFCEGDDGRL